MNSPNADDAFFSNLERDFLQETENALISPEDCALWLTRGHVFLDHRRHREAIACYESALKCDPGSKNAYSSLVSAYEMMNDLEAAMEIIIRAFRSGLGILDGVDFQKYPQELLKKFEDSVASI